MFIVESTSLIAARIKAGLAGMPHEHYKEAIQTNATSAKKVPADVIGRALTRKEAEKLLGKMG